MQPTIRAGFPPNILHTEHCSAGCGRACRVSFRCIVKHSAHAAQGLLARKDAELEERGKLLLKSKAAIEQLQRERDELRAEAQQASRAAFGLAHTHGRPTLLLCSITYCVPPLVIDRLAAPPP